MVQPLLRPSLDGELRLTLRSRVELFRGNGIWNAVTFRESFRVAETALLLCDVWDQHWSRGMTESVAAMAPRMNEVAHALRGRGVQVVHAPSDTMDFYADSPHRDRCRYAPHMDFPEPLALNDPPHPVDASDGGAWTGETRSFKAWTRQHPGVEITGHDAVSDNGQEVYNLFRQLGIRNMLIMGVASNMCVLGRSFGVVPMTRIGIRCVLVRDLTDAMYNPAMPPHVSHERGAELMVEHIERHWCPSVLSDNLLL